MKLKRINYIHLAVLMAAYLLLVLLLTRFEFAYGSNMDWSTQHYAIPDYFRKLFYDTGNLFPSYAMNLGGGENIYNLSYYGLYSPIIMFSYLLPFVKMATYIQVVSIIGVMVSTVIFYIWMLDKFNDRTAFLLSIMFLFSGPLIFHSHRHIMFINNMPFLLMGFISTEKYFVSKKKYMVTFWAFLMIMTNYFFAVSGLTAMAVYGAYRYLRENENVTFSTFANAAWKYLLRLAVAVLMAGCLLIPTLFALLSGRDKGNVHVDYKALLPSVNLGNVLYAHYYSMGLCCFALVGIVAGVISKNKCRRFLGIVMCVLLSCPVVVYILNGGLYIDGKVLIPFMPLCLLLTGHAYYDVIRNRFRWKIVMPITLGIIAIGFFCTESIVKFGTIPDMIVLCLCLFLFMKFKKQTVLDVGISMCMIVITIGLNFTDTLVPIEEINNDNSEDLYSLAEYAEKKDGTYRTANLVDDSHTINTIYNCDMYTASVYSSLHNENFNHFYFNELHNENKLRNPALTTQSRSLLNNIYFSDKYLLAYDDSNVISGYKKIKTKGKYALYENDNVLPFGYATSKLMSEKEYKSLSYPASLSALLNYTVVDDSDIGKSDFMAEAQTVPSFEMKEVKGLSKRGSQYLVDTEDIINQTVELPQSLKKDELLLVSFKVNNNFNAVENNELQLANNDAKIGINGIYNTLTDRGWKYYNNNTTFEYVISTNGKDSINSLDLVLKHGKYTINDIKCSIMKIPDCANSVDAFKFDKEKTSGDNIYGEIDVKNDGYFNISLPYDKGYEIYIDGKKTELEKADTAFIGCKISKGKHDIKITYRSSGLNIGIGMTAFGFLAFAAYVVCDTVKSKKHKK